MPEILSKLFYGLVGAALSQLFSELTRARRKMRLLVRSAFLPTVVLTVRNGVISIRIVGEYRIVNMSELPVHLRRPHLLGYNVASRGFQFKIMPALPAKPEEILQEISIPPNDEVVLITDQTSTVHIERLSVRNLPVFLWLETVELVRIGSRKVFRHKSNLYRRTYASQESGESWFHPTGYELGSTAARLIAWPGKILLRRKGSTPLQ